MTTTTTNTTTGTSTSSILEKGYLPQLNMPGAHWFVRLPLSLILGYQSYLKFIDLAGGAEAYGFPVWMWFMAAFGEAAAVAGFLLGGAILSLAPADARIRFLGDLVTRLAGLATVAIVAAVIYIVYWGPWLGFQTQLLMLAAGAFFMLRGNRA